MKYSIVGIDGNAYNIMGYTANAMKYEGFTKDEIDAYFKNATSSDYNHLVAVSSDIIDKCNEHYNTTHKDEDDDISSYLYDDDDYEDD